MIKMTLFDGRGRKRAKNLFRTDYLLKITKDDILKYGSINKKSITITDKKMSYNLIKENMELKQQILLKEEKILKLERVLLELKKQGQFPPIESESIKFNNYSFQDNLFFNLNGEANSIDEYKNVFD